VKEDSLPALYSPNYLARTETAIYLVETKAHQQTSHPNVERKLKSAAAWRERIDGLPHDQRNGLPWHFVLLGDLLEFARVRRSTMLHCEDGSPYRRGFSGSAAILGNCSQLQGDDLLCWFLLRPPDDICVVRVVLNGCRLHVKRLSQDISYANIRAPVKSRPSNTGNALAYCPNLVFRK
jgi:hypothetical protein